MQTLSSQEARLLALNCQGLHKNDFFGKGKEGTLKAIEHLGYIQLDTISIIARAHHHTLWTRVKNYKEQYLNELLEKDKTIFEYWSHAASYLPISEYRFSLYRKNLYSKGKSHWFEDDKKTKKLVLKRIQNEGALQSKDFEHKQKRSGPWYEWKPAKRALEQLFMEGELMVAKRQGFHKVYDLTERVLPSFVDSSTPTNEEYAEHLILKAISTHGFVSENEITYLRRLIKPTVNKKLKELTEKEKIIPLKVQGIEKNIFYTTEQNLKLLNDKKRSKTIHLLSPFDNVLIQRKRIEQLFNYNYLIECYVPEPKRIFGYFCLPILIDNEFIGRLDPKADRKTKTFYIKNFFLEKEPKNFKKLLPQVCIAIKEFAVFNGCEKIVIEKTSPKSLLTIMRKEF